MSAVGYEKEAVVGEDLSDGLLIANVDGPLDRVENLTVKVVCSARRVGVSMNGLVEERSLEVFVSKIRDQRSIGFVRAIVIVVVVDGV